jgi:glycosyltransferase involved in cell wall biosynthesis
LATFPSERELPAAVGDDHILDDAVAWRERALALGDEREEREAGLSPGRSRAHEPRRSITNIVFVSHCDFRGNSALHVHAIASELQRRGLSPVVAVPDNPESVLELGPPPFPVLAYAEALAAPLVFPDGRGPDLVHAFSPRELVRQVTIELVRRYGCGYVVHLEDNDEVVLSGELGDASVATLRALPLPVLDRIVQPRQSHPLRSARFVECAGGVTVLVERLLELVPKSVPAVVMHAGFDEAVLTPRRPRDKVRAELGLDADDLVIVYTGNVHSLNRAEMRDLYGAVAELRRAGERVVLVKTGLGSGVVAAEGFPALGEGLRDLGWVPRSSIPELLAAADVLVQPGAPGAFNDFRFPSKLPEFLASGRPVVLPRTNLGLELRDGEEALLLERGDAAEIASAVTRLAADPALRSQLAERGRAYALRELRWSSSVDRLQELLGEIETDNRPATPAWALDGADPPVKLIVLVPDLPSNDEGQEARSHGPFGFCLEKTAILDRSGSHRIEFPFCARVDAGDLETVQNWFESPAYIRIGGSPLVLYRDEARVVRATEPDAIVEGVPSLEDGYALEMCRRLAIPLPDHPWYRTLVPPVEHEDDSIYAIWLRKLVLQTALRAPAQAPLLFVDASAVWRDPTRRAAWLAATQSGMREGVRQFYASQSLRLSVDELDVILSST